MFRAAERTFAGSSLGETVAWREMATMVLASNGFHPSGRYAERGVGQLVGSDVFVHDGLVGQSYRISYPDGQRPLFPGREALEVRGRICTSPACEEIESSVG